MAVIYEWIVEDVDIATGDIIDVSHWDSFQEAADYAHRLMPMDRRNDIALVRDDNKGREWAYVAQGSLPDYFSDAYGTEGSKVPKRFRLDLLR